MPADLLAHGLTFVELHFGQPPALLDPAAGATAVTVSGAATGPLSAVLDPSAGLTLVSLGGTGGSGGSDSSGADNDFDISGNEPIALGLLLRGSAHIDDATDPEGEDFDTTSYAPDPAL